MLQAEADQPRLPVIEQVEAKGLDPTILLGIVIGGAVLLILLIVGLLCCCCRKGKGSIANPPNAITPQSADMESKDDKKMLQDNVSSGTITPLQ